MRLIQDKLGLPQGVINLVHGSKDAVEYLISHKDVKGVTFVGSTPVAKRVYKLAGEHGKRAIVNGGAKNSIVVMPDANIESTISPIVSSFFGNSGQRCLAGSNLIPIGMETHERMLEKFVQASENIKVGYGLDPLTDMGPVISQAAKERIVSYVERGSSEGAKLVRDGREYHTRSKEYQNGFYLGPTIFDQLDQDMSIAREEIFGPVASVLSSIESLDEAIESINENTYFGNMACIFTSSGWIARKFRREVKCWKYRNQSWSCSARCKLSFRRSKGIFLRSFACSDRHSRFLH
jgi:malonate-semialdehyde dehydrogenase (acetylating)/methylmalonate-semialdehyde dehydrogenase